MGLLLVNMGSFVDPRKTGGIEFCVLPHIRSLSQLWIIFTDL